MRLRRLLVLTSVVAAAALSLLAAGCGGRSSPRVASVTSSTTTAPTSTQNEAAVAILAFSRCMRSHGVPTFPDPSTVQPRALKEAAGRLAATNPRFTAAARACNHLLPNGGSSQETPQQTRTQLADGRSFARCMRSRGVSRFPDPSAQSGLTVQMVQAQGIDVHSPSFLRVVQTCLPASHGALTPAKVREALAHAGS